MRRMPAAVAAAALALSAGFSLPAAAAAPPPLPRPPRVDQATGSTAESRARRSDLLMHIAALSDQVDGAHADVVAVQFEQTRLEDAASAVHELVRAHAVAAYIHGPDAPAELAAPTAYLAVAARKDREMIERYQRAKAAADAHQARIDAKQAGLVDAARQLDEARGQLATLEAADEARLRAAQKAAEQEAADAARRRALAAQALANAQALAAARSAGGAPGAGLSPSHAAATQKQAALMAKYPFGVLNGGALPASLAFTGQTESGLASWYGGDFNGQPTSSGAIYDEDGWTAASLTLPLGTLVVVTRNGVSVLLLINDHGPYVDGRIIDLSAAAAQALGVGVSPVDIRVVAPVGG